MGEHFIKGNKGPWIHRVNLLQKWLPKEATGSVQAVRTKVPTLQSLTSKQAGSRTRPV